MKLKKRTTLRLFPALVLITGVAIGIMSGIFFALINDLPQIRSLEGFRPSSVTRIYSSDKVLLAELFMQKRDPVSFQDIPRYLIQAVIATEDRNFYHHSGIDLKGIFRAVVKDALAGEFIEGASTLTQQLTKTLFLNPQKTLTRKLKEAILSVQLERRYTKNEILTMYLNQVYFGSGAYGVESAARLYFGKPVKNLTLSECALIAGMPKAPSRYSPLVDKDLSLKRRNIVLRQMLATGIITASQYDTASRDPFPEPDGRHPAIKAPYFIEFVKKQLETTIGASLLYKGGLTVYTTLSYSLQMVAETALSNGLNALQQRMNHRTISCPDPQGALLALNVDTGEMLAMSGGKNFFKTPFNRAVSARRQPGSAFKPIIFAHAVERGFTQSTMLLDAPVVFKGGKNGSDWQPENFSHTYQGEIPLRTALALSENIPAVRLIEKLGITSVIKFAHSLGIQSTLSPNLSLALGTSEVSLLELTAAYSVFPNRGKWIQPFAVTEVVDHHGRIIWQIKPESHIAMSRGGAAVMVNMLEAVIREGTGKKAGFIHRPVAGKTGTTNRYRDALFIGFSPAVAAGVWVGNDDHSTLGKGETGASAALPIWIEFMQKTLEPGVCHYFDIPDDTVKISINSRTGQRSFDHSTNSADALFIKGSEPGC
ncbi:MAG: penicillin-binding protein 1A [Desulfobacterales bacterium]|nr:penicillin-binding protein 1A [Desulfobacterales bacterium]MDD4392667.1 penicillin-binding protein 1A [Desulfobacterales bacterium]